MIHDDMFVYCVCMYCVIEYKYDVTFINKYYILFNILIIIMIFKELSLIISVSAGLHIRGAGDDFMGCSFGVYLGSRGAY